MRYVVILMFLLCLTIPLNAQYDPVPYEIAQNRIQEAVENEATELDLSGLNLTELLPELWQLSGLEVLHLSDNQLTSLPAEIGQLTNLRVLGLSYNHLRSLPPEL